METSLGIEELRAYWACQCEPGSADPLPQDVVKTLLAGLQLNVLETLRYLHEQQPSYAQFKAWVWERNGGELKEAALHCCAVHSQARLSASKSAISILWKARVRTTLHTGPSVATPELTYQQLLMWWISRIPFAAALVWLAVHASRESALAKRLEEDYGFKVSVASSFQGFQEQMKIVGGAAAGNKPLKTLCEATLAQITNPPGRIYEKHPLAVSPSEELLKAAQTILDAAKAAKPLILLCHKFTRCSERVLVRNMDSAAS